MIGNILLLKDKTVLFAEDDKITRAQMSEVLEMLFGKVFTAQNGEEAYALYKAESPDIIISDIKMPKKDGLSLIRQIRQKDYTTPILLLTSFAELDLLISAANLSVDGYLIKPIGLETLTYTLCKAIRRTNEDIGLVILGKDLYYNAATKELYQNKKVVSLGIKEQELLILLINNRTKTVTKESIGRELWPLDLICESAIKNLVLRIRKKLNADIIVSVRGIGYRLNIENNTDI